MDSAPPIPEIDAARSTFVDAVRRHEPGTIAGLYSPLARLIAPNTAVVRGRNDVALFWSAGFETGMTGVELEPDDVELHSTLALELGRYAMRVEPRPGVELVDRGRYLLLYRLDDGRWLRAAEMFAPELPVPTATQTTGREP